MYWSFYVTRKKERKHGPSSLQPGLAKVLQRNADKLIRTRNKYGSEFTLN